MNPFNQSRFRNEHTLGDAYQIVKDVHDELDIIKMVANNISKFRSGNIELKGEESAIYWKYTEGTEWFLLMDTTDMFSQLLQAISDIEESIDTLTGVVSGQATTISNLSDQLGTLQGTVTAQGLTLVDIDARVTTLEAV